ncbi:MAG TPA: UDP-N-acetylmuramate dehydrogenase [Actinomycetes bacterium]|jgi:UDP-N-acetylmuramate dehydrogenase|nr:UDP-N-acetylmuramate dehydrogenase [Actinomycetes bacterium]
MPTPVGPVDAAVLEAAAAELAARCPGRVSRDLPLAPLTTFRLGGPAALFLRAETVDDLAALAGVLEAGRLPLLIIGRGSNMLVADTGWPGVVLHLGQHFRRVEVDGAQLEAGAATPLPALAARSARAALGGIAFAVAIPGSVGGGVRMNAGAHGGELADRLVWADVFHLTGDPAGRPVRMKPDELGFGYRRSALPAGAVVTAARFALTPAPEASVRAEIDEARRWRRDNQPVNQPNCGSVFANPPEMAAGRVVELLGMKGEGRGGARVSEVHANFIVAADGARSADVLALVRRAMRRARDELGITLRTEVQLVGAFDPDGEEPR